MSSTVARYHQNTQSGGTAIVLAGGGVLGTATGNHAE